MTIPELAVLIDSELDEAWMAEALGHPGAIVSMTRASIGTGQVGENVRYEVTWCDPAAPHDEQRPSSLVGKFPSLDELSRQTAQATSAYVREVGFYRDVQSLVTIPTPQLFHLGEDLDANRFVLLMGDIREADQGDQIRGCSLDEARLAVTALGGLHGPMWGRDLPAEFAWISARDEERAAELVELFGMLTPGFRDRYRERLDEEVMSTVDWLVAHLPVWYSSFETPQTLTHGDYRLDNLLFGRPDGTAAPLTVVDWQTVGTGHGPADAAYFVGAGLLPDLRRQHESDLVEIYHRSLVEAGVDVDIGMVQRDYARGAVSGLLMAVMASQIVGQTERGDEMFCVMAERHTAQMIDLEVLEMDW